MYLCVDFCLIRLKQGCRDPTTWQWLTGASILWGRGSKAPGTRHRTHTHTHTQQSFAQRFTELPVESDQFGLFLHCWWCQRIHPEELISSLHSCGGRNFPPSFILEEWRMGGSNKQPTWDAGENEEKQLKIKTSQIMSTADVVDREPERSFLGTFH